MEYNLRNGISFWNIIGGMEYIPFVTGLTKESNFGNCQNNGQTVDCCLFLYFVFAAVSKDIDTNDLKGIFSLLFFGMKFCNKQVSRQTIYNHFCSQITCENNL